MPEEEEKPKTFGQKIGKFFSDVKRDVALGTKGFIKDTKKNLKLTAEKLTLKREKKERELYERSPQGKKTLELDEKISSIKKDTAETLDNTEQIKEELSKIISTLEVIDFKSENIEKYLTDIVPKLEQSIENVENLDEYIKTYIGPKWKKIKHDWSKFKNGDISKTQFLTKGFLTLGKSFVSVFKK